MDDKASFAETVNRYLEQMRQLRGTAGTAPTKEPTAPPVTAATPSAPLPATITSIPFEQFRREDWMPLPSETATGYLRVSVSGGRGVIPVAGAKVTVSRADLSLCPHCLTVFTDINGNTPPIPLPTVSQTLTMMPDANEAFSLYTVQTESAGLGTVINRHVEIFDGVTAVQQVNMIPPAEGAEPGTAVFDGTPPVSGGNEEG